MCSAEESSTQVEIAFTQALEAEDLWASADAAATDDLVRALADGREETITEVIAGGNRPLLLAISDHGPQMTSHSTREFLAGVAIARQFGRPGVPQDQAWIETLFWHVKGRSPVKQILISRTAEPWCRFRNPHPFTEPAVKPLTIHRCTSKKNATAGRLKTSATEKTTGNGVTNSPMNDATPRDAGHNC